VISVALGATGLAADDACTRLDEPVSKPLDEVLKPGEYELVLVATEGSHRGRRVAGPLTLRSASPSDRSPRTGEIAEDFADTPLFGWVDFDLLAVGAPICFEEPHPSPDSRDPVFPGVLVQQYDFGIDLGLKHPAHTPILLIGTLSNIRTQNGWLDGCGIGLFVQAFTDGRFVGEWKEWGIVADGRGYFCLQQAGAPSN